MKNRLCKRVFLFVMVFSLVLGVGLTVSFAADKEPINLGFIGALSTPFGVSDSTAIKIAVEEINEMGGILGRPVNLIIEDSKRQVPLALAAYKKLVMKDKCLIVFTEGTEGTSACSQLAARLFPQYPHLQFAVWTAHYPLFDRVEEEYDTYKFMFRAFSNSSDSYHPALHFQGFFKDVVGTKKVALLIEDAGWTELWRKGLPGKFPTQKEDFEKNGIEVVYYSETDIKEKMFLPILEKIAESGADTIYWITAYTDTITLTKQWAQSSAKDIDLLFQAGACSYAAFPKMTGGQCLGIASCWPEIAIPFTEHSLPFLKKLRERKAGMMASVYGCYDSPWILKAAVEKVGGTKDVDAVIKALETVEIQRGFYKMKFDGRHDQVKGYPYQPVPIGQFQEDGTYVLVFPQELVKLTNPGGKYIRVKDLRKQAGQ